MDGYKGFLGLLVSSLLVGFLSVIFTLIWVLHYREGLGWDGTTLEFNWHPVLMVTGFVFIQGIGTGHLLGGSGEGRNGRGPGRIALSRVGPTWASEGVRGARGARAEGALAPRRRGAAAGPSRGSRARRPVTRPTWASGQRRPWGGARGRGARPDASGWGEAEHSCGRAGGPLRRPHLVNSLLRVAGTRWKHPWPPKPGRRSEAGEPWLASAVAPKIASRGQSLRAPWRREAL